MKPIAIGAGLGALSGSPGGWIGASFGGIAGGLGGAYYHYSALGEANRKVREASEQLARTEYQLARCEANQSEYSYHCPYCDNYWTFDSYDDYMNFYHDHQ